MLIAAQQDEVIVCAEHGRRRVRIPPAGVSFNTLLAQYLEGMLPAPVYGVNRTSPFGSSSLSGTQLDYNARRYCEQRLSPRASISGCRRSPRPATKGPLTCFEKTDLVIVGHGRRGDSLQSEIGKAGLKASAWSVAHPQDGGFPGSIIARISTQGSAPNRPRPSR